MKPQDFNTSKFHLPSWHSSTFCKQMTERRISTCPFPVRSTTNGSFAGQVARFGTFPFRVDPWAGQKAAQGPVAKGRRQGLMLPLSGEWTPRKWHGINPARHGLPDLFPRRASLMWLRRGPRTRLFLPYESPAPRLRPGRYRHLIFLLNFFAVTLTSISYVSRMLDFVSISRNHFYFRRARECGRKKKCHLHEPTFINLMTRRENPGVMWGPRGSFWKQRGKAESCNEWDEWGTDQLPLQ